MNEFLLLLATKAIAGAEKTPWIFIVVTEYTWFCVKVLDCYPSTHCLHSLRYLHSLHFPYV